MSTHVPDHDHDHPHTHAEEGTGLSEVSRRFRGGSAPRLWKSLDDLAQTSEFKTWLDREFPENASVWNDPDGRRHFLKIMGASLGLAGLTACTKQPEEKIVPYVKIPDGLTVGKPLFFATSVIDGGYAKGVLVESHEGRPTKIEGNPDHPASRGGTDTFTQADVLGLYDPDRSRVVRYRGEIRTWGDFTTTMKHQYDAHKAIRGAGLRIVTGTITSPTLGAQLEALLTEMPEARWYHWEPVSSDNARAGRFAALGGVKDARYRFDRADVILNLEDDFLAFGPGAAAHARDFAGRRNVRDGKQTMSRMYVVESTPSITGASADHRLALKASQIEGFARAVASGLGVADVGTGTSHPWTGPLVEDLKAAGAKALVIAGESQPPSVHALVHAMNQQLGAIGQTVEYLEPAEVRPAPATGLVELLAEMKAGKVDQLVLIGVNPLYDAPADISDEFKNQLNRVPVRVHFGLHDDETAEYCHWHVPASHTLESWSDARAFEGTVSLVQPLIAPLYGTHSAHELISAIAGQDRSGYDIVRDFWKASGQMPDFEKQWQKALHDGLVAGANPKRPNLPAYAPPAAKPAPPTPGGEFEIVFRPDSAVFDGRYANNAWLQEIPRPITKLVWDNAALVSPATADKLGLKNGDLVDLAWGAHKLEEVGVWILPGQAPDTVTLHLGYRRRRGGTVMLGTSTKRIPGIGVGAGSEEGFLGFDAYTLRTSAAPWFAAGLKVTKRLGSHRFAATQDHWTIDTRKVPEGDEEAVHRGIIRFSTLDAFKKDHDVIEKMGEEGPPPPGTPAARAGKGRELTLYPPYPYENGQAWGLAIDLNSCIGCNACVAACVAENNIPVVGKDQVDRGREMHWIRLDRYFSGEAETPDTHFQPVTCMQCENAPCEVVCPVAATTHSDEGLNDMVYNRCVGTKYCSNNCPYKVRRFNFYLYTDYDTPSLKLQRNPEVTPRSRGVMEKCTYCVQRIQNARIEARREGRKIRDGEVATACEAACPAQAIVFGDINDEQSRVRKWKADPRNYGLLTELNTRPRTTYLGALKNPNPKLVAAAPPAEKGHHG